MTRSLSSWSGGICETEVSIQNAYIKLIEQAEHYIYIENQFFVTTCNADKDSIVSNQVGKALLDRIVEAHTYCFNLHSKFIIFYFFIYFFLYK